MAEEEDVELTLPNKYIRNTSACGTFLTENQLEADQTSSIQSQLQERSPHNSVEQQQQNSNWSDRCPWEGLCRKEGPCSWTPPQGGGRLTHNLSVPDLGSCIQETSPLACQEIQRQGEWQEKPRLYSQEWVHSGLLTTSMRKPLHGSLPGCGEGASRNSMKL